MTTKMIKAILLTAVLLVAAQFSLFPQDTVNWETDWQTALKTAAKNKQPVLIDFYTDWCPHCKRLDKLTFPDKALNDYFKKEKYILVKVNPEKDVASEKKFKVFSYPTLIVFKPDGGEWDRMLGFREPAELIRELENLKKGIGTLDDLLGKYGKFKKDDASEAKFKLMFAINDKYMARADYPDALKMIDEIVRLDKDNAKKQASAALAQSGYIYYKWKKYHKAVDALLAIRKVYPDSQEAADAYASAAYYAEKGKDIPLMLKILKDFVTLYPEHRYVKRAHNKIKKYEKASAE